MMVGMADALRPTRLTSDQVHLVLRRAAELDALSEMPSDVDGYDSRGGGEGGRGGGVAAERDALSGMPSDVDGYDSRAVEEAAREVGLSPAAVRQAVAELRVGA